MTRLQQAIAALHDFGTRAGATHKTTIAQMKNAGFTAREILAAVEAMGGGE